ncbi:MAG TPA: DNA alkylation repair protein [Vitreimonas sp.]|nr:DNA alkylation repair protein [Vitreimonas sp.]
MDQKPRFSLKDFLFNRDKVSKIAEEISLVYPAFKKDEFVEAVVIKFSELELKQRIYWITEQLKNFLPADYRTAVEILLASLPAPADPTQTDNDFGDFIYAPYSHFVATYGLTKNDLEFSLLALKQITTRFSAEDSIRAFLNAYPTETLATLLEWSNDHHYHVRRLASEGTRPRLPWCQKIHLQVEQPLPILDGLFADKTRFVTRSVANHVNDISRTHPELVIATLEKWRQSGLQEPNEMNFIITHSLRTLIKQGYPPALNMLGFSDQAAVTLSDFVLSPPAVKIGETLEFSFVITSEYTQKVLIDYVIYFQNKHGQAASKKVFKLTQVTVTKGQPVIVRKKHPFRANMTTRQLYPGEHIMEIQINGLKHGRHIFMLTT